MEKFVYFNNLFDIYGSSLTEKQQSIFKLYYRENLSMQEIADTNAVSKAFVGKVIKDSECKLEQLEKDYNLLNYKDKLTELSESKDLEYIKKEIKTIVDNI